MNGKRVTPVTCDRKWGVGRAETRGSVYFFGRCPGKGEKRRRGPTWIEETEARHRGHTFSPLLGEGKRGRKRRFMSEQGVMHSQARDSAKKRHGQNLRGMGAFSSSGRGGTETEKKEKTC